MSVTGGRNFVEDDNRRNEKNGLGTLKKKREGCNKEKRGGRRNKEN